MVANALHAARTACLTCCAFLLEPMLHGQEWTRIGPQSFSGALVYDLGRARSVLYGGHDSRNVPDATETWEYDGVRWLRRVTVTNPGSRVEHAMAYDVSRSCTVLFSGLAGALPGGGGTVPSDTWEFNGVDWRRRNTANVPPPRMGHAMAYDLHRARVVLFGGAFSAAMNDTWEYDGIDWTPTAFSAPPARSGHGLVYDMARGRTVLYGGGPNLSQFLNDTWQYDGNTWMQVVTTASPGPIRDFRMVYDVVRSRTVLCGGFDPPTQAPMTATWEYDGANWRTANPTGTPGPRGAHGLAYDWLRSRTVLFGGGSGPIRAYGAVDTWEYDGVSWRQNMTSASPPPRDRHALAYDLARQCTVVVAGDGGASGTLQDTWDYDGVTWTRRADLPGPMSFHALAYDARRRRTVLFGGTSPTLEFDGVQWLMVLGASPPFRVDHAMTYDPARGRVILFGGLTWTNLACLDDTWEYDGMRWQRVLTPASPPARGRHGLTFDIARNRTLLHGGGCVWTRFTDTWLYDGLDWVQVNTTTSPPGRDDCALAYDVARGRTILFGQDAWEFDGTNWRQLSTAMTPPIAATTRMVHDLARRRMVMMGGSIYSAETWELTPAATPTWTRHGAGCSTSGPVPMLDLAPASTPALGTTVILQATALPARPGLLALAFGHDLAQWNGQPLPIDLPMPGLPGCRLWVAPARSGSVLLPHGGSTVSFALAIPNLAALSGMVVGTQALAFDATSPTGVTGVTNSTILRIF